MLLSLQTAMENRPKLALVTLMTSSSSAHCRCRRVPRQAKAVFSPWTSESSPSGKRIEQFACERSWKAATAAAAMKREVGKKSRQ